ncbi:MAG: hypothetical protein QM681_07085 [Novosphingobium sp.]
MPKQPKDLRPFFAVYVSAPQDFFAGMPCKEGDHLHIAGRYRWAKRAAPHRFPTEIAARRFLVSSHSRWVREDAWPKVARVEFRGANHEVWTDLDMADFGADPLIEQAVANFEYLFRDKPLEEAAVAVLRLMDASAVRGVS